MIKISQGLKVCFQVCSVRAIQIITEPVTILKSPFEHPDFDTHKNSLHIHTLKILKMKKKSQIE